MNTHLDLDWTQCFPSRKFFSGTERIMSIAVSPSSSCVHIPVRGAAGSLHAEHSLIMSVQHEFNQLLLPDTLTLVSCSSADSSQDTQTLTGPHSTCSTSFTQRSPERTTNRPEDRLSRQNHYQNLRVRGDSTDTSCSFLKDSEIRGEQRHF